VYYGNGNCHCSTACRLPKKLMMVMTTRGYCPSVYDLTLQFGHWCSALTVGRQKRPSPAQRRRHERAENQDRHVKAESSAAFVLISIPSWKTTVRAVHASQFAVELLLAGVAERHARRAECPGARRHHRVAARLLPQPTSYDIFTSLVGPGHCRRANPRKPHPFLDMAYAVSVTAFAEDGAVIRKFVASGLDFLVSTSFLKASACVWRASRCALGAVPEQDEGQRACFRK
jgi:aromatic-amino-acid transaminase